MKLKKDKIQKTTINFYIKAIVNYFRLKKKHLSNMKIYTCQNCNIKQINLWFDKQHIFKIYSNIYGQHNRSWSNLFKYKDKKIFTIDLTDKINKKYNHNELYFLYSENKTDNFIYH